MGEVIKVDFRKQLNVQPLTYAEYIEGMSEAELYITYLAKELDEQDFMDFVDALNDITVYRQLEPELKNLVDGFWACNAG